MLNYLFRVAVFLQLSYLYDLKIQKNFRSLCTLVIKIHESCCSIFNELCFSLHRLAARSLFIIPLCLSFVKRFFKLFSSFFARFLRNLAFPLASLRLAGCSLAAPIVYHILPRLSSGFSKFFPDFWDFHETAKITCFPRQISAFLSLFLWHIQTPLQTCTFHAIILLS